MARRAVPTMKVEDERDLKSISVASRLRQPFYNGNRSMFVDMDYFNQDPDEPIPVSPADSIPSPVSPSIANKIWDEEATPIKGLSLKVDAAVATPLTPPTELEGPESTTPSRTQNLSRKKGNTIFERLSACASNEGKGKKVEQKMEMGDGGYLATNLTWKFRAVSKECLDNTLGKHEYRNTSNPGSKNSLLEVNNLRLEKVAGVRGQDNKNPEQHIKQEPNPEPTQTLKQDPRNNHNFPAEEATLRSQHMNSQLGKILHSILPFDIHKRISEDGSKCIASLRHGQNKRCSFRKLIATQELTGKLEAVKKSAKDQNFLAFLEQVETLTSVTMCGTHRNSTPGRLKKAKDEISNESKFTDSNKAVFVAWMFAITNSTSNVAPSQAPTRLPITFNFASPGSHEISRIKFQPYQPKRSEYLPETHALMSKIVSLVPGNFRDSGFIYIFWSQGSFGHLKIGKAKNTKQRLKQWNSQCDRTYDLLTQNHEFSGGETQYAELVEKLVHIELKAQRRVVACEGCKRNHKEWFEVSVGHATKVFNKWREWVELDPYEIDKTTQKLVLKSEMFPTLLDICKVVPKQADGTMPGRRVSSGRMMLRSHVR